MAKKSFLRWVGEKLGILKPETPETPAPSANIPPKPTIPPHPRRAPASALSVDERVALYKQLSPKKRREQRPQDEGREYWELYDGGK